jgi:hypothetical protein
MYVGCGLVYIILNDKDMFLRISGDWSTHSQTYIMSFNTIDMSKH